MITPTDTIQNLPVQQLHESPFNPRRTFIGIDELALSIQAEGRVHQPLLVRPRYPNPLRDDITDGWEVVFGHRRLRAAATAGLGFVPCMVRTMTDAEARSAQIAENLQRADVHPIEEAEGMQAMMADGLSADELAEVVGKSRSYVYSRLKLLQACPQIRDACLAGEIGSEVALLIARLRTDKLQAKALGYIRGKGYDLKDGGKRSFRSVQALMKEKFTLHLKSAIFPPEDAELVPVAGVCSSCPKLSGNAPEFRDFASSRPSPWFKGEREPGEPDLCTDPDCFAEKKKAHLVREAARLRAEGKVVVDGGKAMQAVSATGDVKGAYVALKDVRAQWKQIKILRPVPVLIQNPRDGKLFEAVSRAELEEAGVQPKAAAKARSGGSYDPEADRREREEREQRRLGQTAGNKRLLAAVRAQAASRERSSDELRLVLRQLLGDADNSDDGPMLRELHGVEDRGDLIDQLPAMTPDALALLLLDVLIVREVECTYWQIGVPEPLAAMAKLYGIDADQASAEPVQTPAPAAEPDPAEATDAASTPPPAARAAKGAAGKPGKKAKPGAAAKYRCARTGSTWTGRGLKPAWVNAHLAAGGTLAELETTKAAPAAQEVKDDAGGAGEVGRDPNTADMFETAGV